MEKSLSLLDARKKLGLTQSQIAVALDVTAEYISMLEHGRKSPSRKLLNKLDKLLNPPPTVYPSSPPSRQFKVSESKNIEDVYAENLVLKKELIEAREVIRDLAAALASKPTSAGHVSGVVCERSDGRKGA